MKDAMKERLAIKAKARSKRNNAAAAKRKHGREKGR